VVLLDQLDRLGLADSTIVIFTSDHGDYMGDHQVMLKLDLHYQGLIRVPLIWHDPAAPALGRHDGRLSGTIDLAPTMLARAGLKPFQGMQGEVLQERQRRRGVVVEDFDTRFFRQPSLPCMYISFVDQDWRMTVSQDSDDGELYDLKNDPHELRNLWRDPAAQATKSTLLLRLAQERMALREQSPRLSGVG